jgi:hypothetical protein
MFNFKNETDHKLVAVKFLAFSKNFSYETTIIPLRWSLNYIAVYHNQSETTVVILKQRCGEEVNLHLQGKKCGEDQTQVRVGYFKKSQVAI